jgi:hypothetical protein
VNWLQRLLGRNSNRQNTDGTDPASGHTLERQLSELSTLGLSLNEGVSIDDLLYSFKREEYEERPYDLILFVLGIEVEREPWDRCVSSQAWNFDHECITNTGDYTKIAKRLCQIAGNPSVLTNIHDHFDRENDIAWIEYTADGVKRHLNIEINDDWVDPAIIPHLIEDIERNGHHFYFKENGQAMIMYYLSDDSAAKLNRLSGNALRKL